MAVKIRLTRLGDKRTPFYRIVVADSRVARDAKYIELIGTYNPLVNPAEVKVDTEKAAKWLKNGAQPTETVRELLKKAGVDMTKKKPEEKKAKKATKAAPKAAETKKAPAKKTTTKTAAKKTAEAKAEA